MKVEISGVSPALIARLRTALDQNALGGCVSPVSSPTSGGMIDGIEVSGPAANIVASVALTFLLSQGAEGAA